MNKKENLSSLDQQLDALYVQKKEIEKQVEVCSVNIRRYADLVDAKKAGNVLLIIAAIAIVPEIVLILSHSVFSALGAFVLGVFLVSGLWKKIRGMRDAKDVSQKLAGIDIDDVREEMNRLNREKDKLEENISRVKAERYDLTHYHGKDWRILQIDPRDSATLKALEQDLRDVVDAIIHSYDEVFLSNNWLINYAVF